MNQTIQIRRARPEEAALLSDLIYRSKAHWGYEPALLEFWRPQLTLAPETIARDPIYVAEEVGTGRILGVVHYYPLSDDEVYLDDLFVEPVAMRQGVGTLLWRFCVEQARALGARSIVFGADPHARPFYERQGAVVTGWRETPEVPGRARPRMRYTIPSAERGKRD